MGKPMAKNLLKAGYGLVVCDLNQEAVEELAALGAERAETPAAVAGSCDTIITMLPNSPQVKQVVLGENGLLCGIRKGAVVIDMSSIAPLASIEVAEKLREKGAEMLDAPVSGGEPKAIDGTLAIMVGGDEQVFEAQRELLLKMGASAVYTGKNGSGNVTKLSNQIIVALNIAAMSEAMVLAEKAGVDPEKVFDAIKGGLAGSTVLNAKMPMVLDRNFKPGFRIELHIKDLLNALETGHGYSVPLPLTAQVLEIMQSLKVSGNEKEDHCALIKYYERLADIEVQRA